MNARRKLAPVVGDSESYAIRKAYREARRVELRDHRDFERGLSMPQPFIRTPTPHNQLDDDDFMALHDNGDHTFDLEEGETVLPEPCWDQHPDGPDGDANNRRRYYNPTTQWGGSARVTIDPPNTGMGHDSPITFDQLCDYKLNLPAQTTFRLSSIELSGLLVATDVKLFVVWTVDIGVGRVTQTKQYHQLVGPLLGQVDTDILVTLPARVIRISGEVFDNDVGVAPPRYLVEVLAHVSPTSPYPGMVSP